MSLVGNGVAAMHRAQEGRVLRVVARGGVMLSEGLWHTVRWQSTVTPLLGLGRPVMKVQEPPVWGGVSHSRRLHICRKQDSSGGSMTWRPNENALMTCLKVTSVNHSVEETPLCAVGCSPGMDGQTGRRLSPSPTWLHWTLSQQCSFFWGPFISALFL